METPIGNGDSPVKAALLSGVRAWTVFWVVETAFLTLLPWILHPGHLYTQYHGGFTLLLLGLYVLLGIVGAIAIFVCLRYLRQHLPPLEGCLELQLAFCVGTCALVIFYALGTLASATGRLSEMAGVFLAPIVLIGGIAACRATSNAPRLRFLQSPWLVACWLIGTPSIMADHLGRYGAVLRLTGTFSWLAATYLVWLVLEAKQRRHSIRNFRALAVVSLVTLLCSLSLQQQIFSVSSVLPSAPEGKPNVILVSLDTVRADHLSLYGYHRNTSPQLAELGREATVYTGATTSSDVTLTTHASIFTGLYAERHHAHFDNGYPGGRPLSSDFVTLAEILEGRGYLTAGIVANPGLLSPAFGFAQGFAFYDHRSPVVFLGGAPIYSLRKTVRDLLTHLSTPGQFDQVARRAEEINAEAFSFLEMQVNDKRPFFLFLNYMDAHWPYIPPPPFDALYAGKDPDFDLVDYFSLEKDILRGTRAISETEHAHLESQYDGAIAYLDSQIGQLIKKLGALGLYENSIFIVTSDHGEAFGKRALFGHGVSVYQNQVRVPLIIKYANENAGRVVEGPVNSVDLLPTILAGLNYQLPDGLDGRSLLTGNIAVPRFSESFPRGMLTVWNRRFARVERAVFLGNLKFVGSTKGARALYDLSVDPEESRDVCSDRPVQCEHLESVLSSWLARENREGKGDSQLDPMTVERLKSLGYVN